VDRNWQIGAAVLLLAVMILIYLPGFKAPFLFDDRITIVENSYIQIHDLGLRSLAQAAFQDFKQNRPLANLSFAVNFYFNRDRPFGYHLVNFFFFALTGLGVFFLIQKFLGHSGRGPAESRLAAWLSALLWACHPLNTQAVTYISQRFTSMAGAFSIWSVYFFHLAQERKERRIAFFLISGLLCFCALLCKETAFVLPAIIFLYKIYFFDGLRPGWFRRNRGWLSALAVFYFAGAGFVFRPSMLEEISASYKKMFFTPWQRFLTEPRVLLWYLLVIVFPIPQSMAVAHDFMPSRSFFHPAATLASFLFIIALLVFAIRRAPVQKPLSFLILWYFLQLLVEALPLPLDLAFEHRLYLASLSLLVPAAAIPVLSRGTSRGAIVLILAIALFFGFFSFKRNQTWRSAEILWKDAVMKAPGYPLCWYNYCTEAGLSGNCRAAVSACRKAITMAPGDYKAHHNLGVCLLKLGDADAAEKELLEASRLRQ